MSKYLIFNNNLCDKNRKCFFFFAVTRKAIEASIIINLLWNFYTKHENPLLYSLCCTRSRKKWKKEKDKESLQKKNDFLCNNAFYHLLVFLFPFNLQDGGLTSAQFFTKNLIKKKKVSNKKRNIRIWSWLKFSKTAFSLFSLIFSTALIMNLTFLWGAVHQWFEQTFKSTS